MRSAHTPSRLTTAAMVILAFAGLAGGRSAQASTTVSKARTLYVAIGDSFTQGVGTDQPLTESFPALLARHLPPHSGFLNLGEAGYTAGDARTIELPKALTAHVTLATVWLGTNDVHNGIPTPTFKSGLRAILRALHRKHVHVFVGTLPNFKIVPVAAGNPDYSVRGQADNVAIVALAARYGATVVDVYPASQSLWGHPNLVNSDGIHLATKGYAKLANLFYRVMHAQGALGP